MKNPLKVLGSGMLSLSLIVWLPLSAGAQETTEASADSAPPQTTAQAAEIFELSPFVVDTEADSGYLATQSLAGTRIRSNLRDVASTVTVLTKELLEDIGASDVTEYIMYTAGGESGGMGGSFVGEEILGDNIGEDAALRSRPQTNIRIRGLLSPDLTRDFFLTDMRSDFYNTERVEVNRGANAILFGLGSPAGVINTGLIRAQFNRDRTEVRLRLRDYGSYRGQFDHNVVAIEDTLALRVAGMYEHRVYQQQPAFQDQERIYLTGTWRIDDRTNVNFSTEQGEGDANRPRVLAPVEFMSGWLLAGKPYYDVRQRSLPGRWPPRNQDGTEFRANPEGIEVDLGSGLVLNSSDAVEELPFYTPGFFEHASAQVHSQPTLRDPDQSLSNFAGRTFGILPSYGVQPALPEGHSVRTSYTWNNPAGIRNMYGGRALGVQHQGLLSRDMYDWVKNMLGGDAAFQMEEFQTYNASIDRRFLQNKNLGVEFVVDHQFYKTDAHSSFQVLRGILWKSGPVSKRPAIKMVARQSGWVSPSRVSDLMISRWWK